LSGRTTELEFWNGILYFIAAERLFKLNLLEGLGISEIKMKDRADGYVPLSLCAKGKELAVLFKQKEDISVWSLLDTDRPLSPLLPLGFLNEWFEQPRDIEYCFMLAKSAPHGWIEHWDTEVYAKLQYGAAIGTEDICDNFVYPESASMNKTTDRTMEEPWAYSIRAGHEGEKRPIGKTIGIRIYIENNLGYSANCWQKENIVYHAKIAMAKQEEVLNANYNPNRAGTDDALATEFFQLLLTEED
jgi:hypothetical protein